MATALHRLGDISTSHGCYPSRPNNQASSDTFTNSIGNHRQGDSWQVHCCGLCHGAVLSAGSPTVYTNNKQQGRVNDPVSCGCNAMTGSPDVFVGP